MLIGLTGPKQAGKDTVYERAAHIMADVLPVERASFADALYESAAAALSVRVEDLRRWKSDPEVRVVIVDRWSEMYGSTEADLTIREYLQRYGTEAHREIFGDDFWVDNVHLEHDGKLVFVTDVRFPNEGKAVRQAGGVVVRVDAPRDIENTGDAHASEAGLPAELIDARLPNYVRDDDFRTLDSNVNALLRSLFPARVEARA